MRKLTESDPLNPGRNRPIKRRVSSSPAPVSRVSFAVSEALSVALDDIERSGALPGLPLPLKPLAKAAFEEAVYALADYAQRYGEVPRAFRLEVIPARPRAQLAEQQMLAINQILNRISENPDQSGQA